MVYLNNEFVCSIFDIKTFYITHRFDIESHTLSEVMKQLYERYPHLPHHPLYKPRIDRWSRGNKLKIENIF